MAIGEVVLGAILQVLFQMMAPPIIDKFTQFIGVSEEVKKLESVLRSVEKVLKNADEELHKDWLDELGDIAYDMEDLLDEINTERLRLEAMASREHGKSFSTILQDLNRKFSKLKLKDRPFRKLRDTFSHSVEQFRRPTKKKITLILNRLEEKVKTSTKLGLDKVAVPTATQGRPQTTHFLIPTVVYGRDDDKKIIAKLLKEGEASNVSGKHFSVITILGMPGIGKTTLAQLIYNDEIVKELKFEVTSWACSQSICGDDAVKKVCVDLLHCAKQRTSDVNNLGCLQSELKSWLDRKKFLIVIDDLWMVKIRDWDRLCAPLNYCAEGSRVIITSQNLEVAKEINSTLLHHVRALKEGDCLNLFREKAFLNMETEKIMIEKVGVQKFEEIGKKCRGVPLAAECMGTVFRRNKANKRNLENLLNCEIWCFQDGIDEIFPLLKQSYFNLPSHLLKRCFQYFSLFPIDHPIKKEILAQMWMGEGFILQQDQNQSEFDLAHETYECFKYRSFFQNDGKMHDLIRCLACHVSRKFYLKYLSDNGILQDHLHASSRHMSFLGNSYPSRTFQLLKNVAKLRTILLQSDPDCFISSLSKWEVLRVMDLSNSGLSELPDSIGKLRHLRYIGLRNCNITRLPDSICKLFNLQTLDLQSCKSFVELPTKMDELVSLLVLNLNETQISKLPDSICGITSLRTLSIMGCDKLSKMPPQMGKLTGLMHLTNYIVSNEIICGIGELKDLNNLRGALVISNLGKIGGVNMINEAKNADMESKIDLEELILVGGELDVLEALKPHISLKSLSIESFAGDSLPNWLFKMKRLESLLIRNCHQLKPDLESELHIHLPSLKNLSIN